MWFRSLLAVNSLSNQRFSTAATTRHRRQYYHYHQYQYRNQTNQQQYSPFSLLATPFLLLLVLQEDFFQTVMVACQASDETSSTVSSLSSHLSSSPNTNTNILSVAPTMKIGTIGAATTKTIKLRFYLVRHGESVANQRGVLAGQEDVPLTDTGVVQARRLGQNVSSWWLGNDNTNISDDRPSRPMILWKLYSSDLIRAIDTAVHLLKEAAKKKKIFGGVIDDDNHDRNGENRSSEMGQILLPVVVERMQLDVRLRERSYGARQGRSKTVTEDQAMEIWRSLHKHDDKPPPPYETDADLWKRGSEWLLDVVRHLQDEQKSLKDISSSGGFVLEEIKKGGEQKVEEETVVLVYNVLVASHAGIIRELVRNLFSLEELTAHGAQFDEQRNNRLIIPNASVTIVEVDVTEDDGETPMDRDGLVQRARLVQLGQTHHILDPAQPFHDD